MKCMSKGYVAVVNKLTNYPTFGSNNTNIVDMLVSLLLAISPLLQHYKGIGVNAGFLVLIVCLPYIGLKLLFRLRNLPWKNIWVVLPLVLFQIFRVIAHGTTFTELAHATVLCGYFVAIALGGINLKYVARAAYLVAMAAGIGIIVQSICYYLFGFHLQLVATSLLLEESHIWVKLAETGIIGVTGTPSAFYRPSAFFLEPSHMFLYFVPNLFLLLLTPEMNWTKRISAVIVSAGLLLSTSGMGIAFVVGAWLLQLGFSNGKENLLRFTKLFTKQNILRCIAFVLIFAVIALILPFLRYGILRVFIGSQAVNEMIMAEKNPTVQTEPIQQTEPSVQTEQTEQTNPTAPTTVAPSAPTEESAPTESTEIPEENPTQPTNPGSTAISGRTERAISLIRYRMSGSQYLVGVSDSVEHIEFNLPGFFNTLYRYGIIGTLLSYLFYLCCAAFGKCASRWTAIIILGISLVSAHTHGTFYMLFYVLILIDGIVSKSAEKGIPPQSIE